MSLKEQITADMKEAMKARDELRTQTLRMVRAELMKMEKEANAQEATDEVVQKKLSQLIKQRREAAEAFEKGGRTEMAEQELAEAELLKAYLPEEATEEEIRAAVQEVIAQTGASGPADMGKVMGPSMGRLKKLGKTIDGKLVSAVVKEELNK